MYKDKNPKLGYFYLDKSLGDMACIKEQYNLFLKYC